MKVLCKRFERRPPSTGSSTGTMCCEAVYLACQVNSPGGPWASSRRGSSRGHSRGLVPLRPAVDHPFCAIPCYIFFLLVLVTAHQYATLKDLGSVLAYLLLEAASPPSISTTDN